MNILLVEDECVTRECARMSLEGHGHSVVAVPDGIKALEVIQESLFDIVLMDIKMPGMDGIEVTRRIRQLPEISAQTPIVAITGFHEAELPELTSLGFNAHLPKPFEIEELIATIHSLSS